MITTPTVLWTSDVLAQDSLGTYFMPTPTQGVGFNAVQGREWLYRGVDLRFTVRPRNAANMSEWNNNQFRLMIVKNKEDAANYPSATLPTTINDFISTKWWNVVYDKVFPISTGYFEMFTPPFTPPAIETTIGNYRPCSYARNFRFKIPLRYKAKYDPTLTAPNNGVNNPEKIYVYIFSQYLCTDCVYEDVRARIYFVDI